MAKNLYHVLEVSEAASQGAIQTLFEQKRDLLQAAVDAGDQSAKGELWAVKQAFETLSNPSRRAAYNQSLHEIPPAPVRGIQATKGPILSWKLNAFLFVLLAAALVGFGLQLGRTSKKEESSVRAMQASRAADNDTTRATTERVQVEGAITNQGREIEVRGQVANRVVGVYESAENRAARELEYRANAGTEVLRQQQQALNMEGEQMKWERQHAEQEQALRRSQATVASDRLQTIQLMISSGRLFEARTFATTPQEFSVVRNAERAECVARATTLSRRNKC